MISAPVVADPVLMPDSEAGVRLLLDALPMGVVVLLPDGQERFRNTVAMSIAGARHADVLIEVAAERLLNVALRGFESREQIQLAGPPQRVLEVRAIPLADGGAIAIIDDVTDRWRIDQVRTDFVANVSHELKTPVGALSLLAEAVQAADTDIEQVRHFTSRMQIEVKRLTAMISDLVALSQVQGDLALRNSAPVEVQSIIAEAIDATKIAAEQQHIEVSISDDVEPGRIFGDEPQLVTALSNLISNAIKYSPTHTKVGVGSRRVDNMIEISVTDQGPGIPEGDVERIFERFYRVDPARSRDTGGTGLGLAIVKHVCANHGGECVVWSEVGQGSTFTLRIPAYLNGSATPAEVTGK